ncbi:extracellular solute-binding protein [Nonomuraea sp. KC401]|uniref:ABC transporter substrate-binding protein n=1 Tax=unclassified Nonomuraea TaxID=2593643 RepID=UPI0010FEB271|nr:MULTISPECIES: extracellular solute-binding protein [unclassified Nonomuraea]NBE97707.1 extracellular solute-binding protein [Nonomuraea sp. K271]TLF63835.1 extracellular solute-binding protein [Nonomuraea sp. KC401]
MSRRSRRLAALCLAGVMLAVSACGGGSSESEDGAVELRFGWWGNNDRADATQKVIDAFQAKNPGITVKGSYTDFNSYFDRLATEVAAGRAPDVITLGGAYPREYGDRGALLDLSKVSLKTDKIGTAALDNGKFGGVQYGVPSGVNAIATVINPAVFDKAGVEVPDGDTWTWDDFKRISTELSGKLPKGTFALADPTRSDMLDAYSRQRGEALYTADGKVAISAKTLVDWWTMTLELRDAGASPPASQTAELITQPAPEQTLMGRGLAAMQFDWSNQLTALTKAAGTPLKLIRVPGESDATQPGMWLQASQIYSINARSEHPEEAAKFVDFLVNSADAGKIILADRGIPANSDVREGIASVLGEEEKAQAEFIDDLTPKAGPPLVIGPAGSTDTPKILDRVNAEVLFGRQKPAEAAADFIQQVGTAIQQ